MAPGKPSKALRPKLRWIGLELAENLGSRNAVEKAVEQVEVSPNWRLFDCKDGKAILRVHLADYDAWRAVLKGPELTSITASGKIRLVRDRLGLPKPVRRR